MKKLLKSKLFGLSLIIIVVGGAIYFKLNSGKPTMEYLTETVKTGEIVQTVSATGQVKSASEIQLNFKNAGTLNVLNVKIGDVVTKNEILAQLRASDLAINVSKARASLDEAVANLNKIKAGATAEDINVSQAAVDKAETDLLNAQDDLTNTTKTYSQALENEQENILLDINSSLTKANISLQKIYDTLNYEGNADNFDTSNIALHQQVQSDYEQAVVQVDEAELSYNLAKLNNSDENINQATTKALAALTKVDTAVSNLSQLLDYVIITTNLTQSELDTIKSTINTERTTTNSSVTAVKTAQQDLIDAELNYQTKVEEADNAVKTAQRNLAKAQADLDFKQAPSRPEDIALYEAQVKRARAELELAQDKYDETIIRAPIDGVITDVIYSIGEQTSLAEPAIKMLAVENFEIEVNIPESDIVKINVGDGAEITLDAFSFEEIFKGSVTTVNPAQTEIQDVIYYRVTVTFNDIQADNVSSLMDKIKPGMTANVDVNTGRKNDVLIIPLRAVKEEGTSKYVEILTNGQPQKIEVALGLKGDDGLVEVVSGLQAGQEVITFIREN